MDEVTECALATCEKENTNDEDDKYLGHRDKQDTCFR